MQGRDARIDRRSAELLEPNSIDLQSLPAGQMGSGLRGVDHVCRSHLPGLWLRRNRRRGKAHPEGRQALCQLHKDRFLPCSHTFPFVFMFF